MRLLKDRYGKERVLFTSLEGRSNLIIFKQTAHKILQDFHDAREKSPDEEELHIIRSAAKLIKDEILSFHDSKDMYGSPEEIANSAKQLAYLTNGLRNFLSILLGDKYIVTAAVGQAIMQNMRPRAVLAPLQVALGVQVHHVTGSKLIVEQLNRLGFSASYHEIQLFEKSAAVNKGGELPLEFNNDTHTLHLHADNVDDTIATLDGLGQLHSMGMMASVCPGIQANKKRRIPRKLKVTHDDLRAVNAVPIHFTAWDGRNPGMKYSTVNIPFPENERSTFYRNINLLHDLAWCCPDPEIPLFSGFMSKVHNGFASSDDLRSGDEVNPASFIFLPIINIDPTDITCLWSTLNYFADYCMKYSVKPIVTFDRQLWDKAFKLIKAAPEGHKVKEILLILGQFHVELSFLGTIGTIMEGSGLSEALEQIIAKNSVPQVMNGKNMERAFRAHMITATALNKIILNKILTLNKATEETEALNDLMMI